MPYAFASAAELAAHDAIDLVVISVRVPLHAAAISAVLGSGKIIFSEWPLAVDTAEAEALTAQAKTLHTPTAVGLQARFNPPVVYLRDLIADGYVGEVLSTTLIGSGGYWGPDTATVDEYLLDESNGSTMRSIAFGHALDALSFVFGEPTDLHVQQVTRRTQIRNVDTDTARPDDGSRPGLVLRPHPRRSGPHRPLPGRTVAGHQPAVGDPRHRREIRVTAPSGHLQVQPLTLQGVHAAPTPCCKTFLSPPTLCGCKASTQAVRARPSSSLTPTTSCSATSRKAPASFPPGSTPYAATPASTCAADHA